MKIRSIVILGFAGAQHAFPFQARILVISSGAEGAVENGAAGEAATWTGRLKAERTGSERIKSLDFMGPVTHQHQDPPNLGLIEQSGRLSLLATTSSAGILERSHRERHDNAHNK
jgi:hypothetical protein